MDYMELVGRLNTLGDFWKAWNGTDSYFYDAATAITDLISRADAAEAREKKCQEAIIIIRKRAEKAENERNKYKMFFDDVSTKPDCNTCDKKYCEYRPKPGQTTRFNCALWIGEKEK